MEYVQPPAHTIAQNANMDVDMPDALVDTRARFLHARSRAAQHTIHALQTSDWQSHVPNVTAVKQLVNDIVESCNRPEQNSGGIGRDIAKADVKNGCVDGSPESNDPEVNSDPHESETHAINNRSFHRDEVHQENGGWTSRDRIEDRFGKEWDSHIHSLHNAPLLLPPGDIATKLHAHQHKGASQAHQQAHSLFRGIICGDEMGTGKTLLTITALCMARDEPGCFSVVVCPKTCQLQWQGELEKNFKPGHAMSVFILDDSRITAHELLSMKYEIIIVSYEFLQSKYKARKEYSPRERGTKRPISALHSNIYRHLKLPIKRLVLDEAQRVKNSDGSRHKAALELFYNAAIILSGTFMDNKWFDVWGLLAFLKGLPFANRHQFMTAFSRGESETGWKAPTEKQMVAFQKLLMAVTIARPASFLNLPGLNRWKVSFQLKDDETDEVDRSVREWKKALRARKGKPNAQNTMSGHAVRAQQWASHHLLIVSSVEDNESESNDDEEEEYQDNASDPSDSDDESNDGGEDLEEDLEDDTSATFDSDGEGNLGDDMKQRVFAAELSKNGEGGNPNNRKAWLDKLRNVTIEDLMDSSRLLCFEKLWRQLRRNYPDKKIVVFSVFLRFLDIIAEMLDRKFGIQALRYDGTVSSLEKDRIHRHFKTCDASQPLLITAGAGSVGLNITEATIVIQTEIWFNGNVEKQAVRRAYRQGQPDVVQYYRLDSGSSIDEYIRDNQEAKLDLNDCAAKPVFREYDEEPIIPQWT